MSKSKVTPFVKVILVGLMILSLNVSAFPRIFHNGSGNGYDEPASGERTSTQGGIIEMYVEEGAGYFLNSYSAVLSFSNQFEWQDLNGVDSTGWLQTLEVAVENIRNAREAYSRLIQKAEATPYNPAVLSRLKRFNYIPLMKTNDQNHTIFKGEVAKYLVQGNITGIYKHTFERFGVIEEMLVSMRDDVAANRVPELSTVWKLNELCAETLIAGQKVAMVFSAL